MSLLAKIRSVRSILTVWYSIVLVCAFALFSGSVYVYLRHLLVQTLEQDMGAELDWIHQLIEVEQQRFTRGHFQQKLDRDLDIRIQEHLREDPRNYTVVISTPEGIPLYKHQERDLPDVSPAARPPGKTYYYRVDRPPLEPYRVAVLSKGAFTVHVAFPERTVRETLDHVLTIFALLAPVVLLASVSGGWFLAGLVLRPVRQIADRTTRISAHNLSERIPPRDVDDELGQLITAINRTLERLESSFEQMKQFSMNVAHELRTPLTILRGESEIALQHRMTDAEKQQLATVYLEETIRMSRIVDDLLTLAKADAGQLTMDLRPVPMRPLIDDLYEDTQLLSASKHLRVELEANEDVVVHGDATRLRQLLRALVTNAVRYTDSGGLVAIASRRNGNTAIISIRDTGIGIPREHLEHIFERFYRVDTARSRDRGGSGLGLSIAKWIADAHGGRIVVESHPGEGSTFAVEIPVAPESA